MSPSALAPAASRSALRWTAAVDAPPAGGVEAGTLLGMGGHDAAGLAGDGTVAVARPGGRVELRAARDGVPALHEDGVAMERSHEIDGPAGRAPGGVAVCGSLRVAGMVHAGGAIAATGPLRVEGAVQRAMLRAGGELCVEGAARGAVLGCGTLAALRRRVHPHLDGLAGELDELLAMARQLLDAPGARGAAPGRAVRALVERRFAELPDRIAAARALVCAAQRDWPGLAAGLAAELQGAGRAVDGPERLADPLAHLDRAAAFLAAWTPARRALTDAGVRIHSAQASVVETPGSVRLTGPGATGCEIRAGGDVVAQDPSGGVLRDCVVRAGGRVRAREISCSHGARATVVIDTARADDDMLRAGVITAGVEIVAGGRLIRFDRRVSGVRIRMRDGISVAETD